MAKILNWIYVEKKLREKGLLVFGPRDIERVFGVTKAAAGFFVYRNTKKGLLVRLKKSSKGSLYALASHMPSQYSTANLIYAPSYISFDAAMSFHGLIPETIYTLTSATVKSSREFSVAGVSYRYYRIKKTAYTGYRPIKYKGAIILMAEPEKALADFLYFVNLKKREMQYERIDLTKIRRYRLVKYVKIFNRPRMLNLVKELYVNAGKPARIY
jgi:predicted transcriptional regulator of viral defense system